LRGEFVGVAAGRLNREAFLELVKIPGHLDEVGGQKFKVCRGIEEPNRFVFRRLDAVCDDLLKHLPIQTEVGHKLLELHILFAKLPQLAEFRRSEAVVFLLPEIKRVLMDAELLNDTAIGVPA
jgi:hypothetical protein